MERQAFHEALEVIWSVVRDANRFVDAEAPWVLRKTDPGRMNAVLYVLAEIIRHLAIILSPYMPESCSKLLDQLSVPDDARDFSRLNTSGRPADGNSLVPGTTLPAPEGVFPRFIDEADAAASGS